MDGVNFWYFCDVIVLVRVGGDCIAALLRNETIDD